jgi:20S proteasome subunit alpha 7
MVPGVSWLELEYKLVDRPGLIFNESGFKVPPLYCTQGYHGCAVGKAKQAAKTEIEKFKMQDMTCRELVKEVAKM